MTLTYSVLYLTIYLHKSNRNVQRTILQQSNGVLESIVEPPAPVPDPPPYEIRRAGITEQLKDGWNREIEKMVRKIQTTDWTEQREIYEQKIADAWSGLRQTEQAQELEQKVKDGVESAKSSVKEGVESAKSTARDVADTARDKAKSLKNTTTEDVKEKLGVAKEKAEEKVGRKRLLEL